MQVFSPYGSGRFGGLSADIFCDRGGFLDGWQGFQYRLAGGVLYFFCVTPKYAN